MEKTRGWSLVLDRSGSPRPRVSRENKEIKPTETITFFLHHMNLEHVMGSHS